MKKFLAKNDNSDSTPSPVGRVVVTGSDKTGIQISKEKADLPEFKVSFGDGSTSDVDFCLVGLGGCGSPLARELSNQGYKIVCLEAGRDRLDDPIIKYPFDASPYKGTGATNINLINALFDPTYSYFEGGPSGPGEGWNLTGTWSAKMNGGSTGHYFCDGVLTIPRVCDGPLPNLFKTPSNNARMSLVEAGGPQWSYSTIQSIMKNEIEDFSLPFYFGGTPSNPIGGFTENPSERGKGGPLTLTQFEGPSTSASGDQATMLNAMSFGADDLDPSYNCGPVPIVDDYNIPENLNSTSQLQFLLRFNPQPSEPYKPVRQYAASAFLNRDFLTPETNGISYGVGNRKIIVINSAQVRRLIESNVRGKNRKYRTSGVEFDLDGVTYKLKAKNVIICAGAGRTPRILERSGIGDQNILNKFGISVKVNNPNVGKHVSNQVGPRLAISTTNPAFGSNFFAQSFMGYRGIPRVFHTIHVGVGPESIGRVTNAVYPDKNRSYFTLEGFMCHPRSQGEIHISESNPEGNLDLNFQFFTDGPDPNDPSSGLSDPNSDIYMACVHMEYEYKVFKRLQSEDPSSDFQLVDPPESIFMIANRAQRFEAMVPYIKGTQVTAAHEAGSCTMNNNPNIGAVDGKLKVHGTDNVFVCDASILPVQNAGNTSCLLYPIGINAGRLIPTVAIGL